MIITSSGTPFRMICTRKALPIPDLASGAFSESSDGGMSCDEQNWMAAAGLDPLHYVADPTHGAVRLNVGALRMLGLQMAGTLTEGTNIMCAFGGLEMGPRERGRLRRSPRHFAKCTAGASGDHF
jgi:hypothetical protein